MTRRLPTLDADASCRVLASHMRAHEPFYFIKHGDAFVECVNNIGRGTCDGELYSNTLRDAALGSWIALSGSSARLYVGDWCTASFSGLHDKSRYAAEYDELMDYAVAPRWLHFECLLLMRETASLLGFYRAVREDMRRKLLLGPMAWQPLADLLRCEFLALPVMPNLIDIAAQIGSELKRRDFDVLLYGAGMAGHVSVVDCWKVHPGRTYINLGSALDPATSRGRTRRQQLAPNRARAFLEQLDMSFATTAMAEVQK
jgi:hypothetical protein